MYNSLLVKTTDQIVKLYIATMDIFTKLNVQEPILSHYNV